MANSLNRFSVAVFLVVSLGLIAFARTSSLQGGPQTTQNVLVTNQASQPVPVSFPHTPTVAAVQSGPWKVSGIANVHVLNDRTSPVPVRQDRDEQGFTASLHGTIPVNSSSADFSVPVSAGKRLVIDRIAIYSNAYLGENAYMVSIYRYGNATGNGGVEFVPVVIKPDPNGYEALGTSSVQIFADPGESINMQARRDANQTDQACDLQIGLFGHYMTLP